MPAPPLQRAGRAAPGQQSQVAAPRRRALHPSPQHRSSSSSSRSVGLCWVECNQAAAMRGRQEVIRWRPRRMQASRRRAAGQRKRVLGQHLPWRPRRMPQGTGHKKLQTVPQTPPVMLTNRMPRQLPQPLLRRGSLAWWRHLQRLALRSRLSQSPRTRRQWRVPGASRADLCEQHVCLFRLHVCVLGRWVSWDGVGVVLVSDLVSSGGLKEIRL